MTDENRNPAGNYSLGKYVTRRQVARFLTGAGAALILPRRRTNAETSDALRLPFITRSIPSSGEKLPVIGLGTWRVFDVGSSSTERAPLEEVLRAFVDSGARVIDSSPMYGRAEEVIGDLATKLGIQSSLFLATKVWTTGKREGIESMERSFQRLQTKRIDLMQVHNLIDAKTHLATMREWKAAGRFRYIGVTHYEVGRFSGGGKNSEGGKVRFSPDQLFDHGARSRRANSAVGERARCCRDCEPSVWRGRFIRARASAKAAGLGGGV